MNGLNKKSHPIEVTKGNKLPILSVNLIMCVQLRLNSNYFSVQRCRLNACAFGLHTVCARPRHAHNGLFYQQFIWSIFITKL